MDRMGSWARGSELETPASGADTAWSWLDGAEPGTGRTHEASRFHNCCLSCLERALLIFCPDTASVLRATSQPPETGSGDSGPGVSLSDSKSPLAGTLCGRAPFIMPQMH